MDLPPLSEDILSRLLVSDLSPSELFDILAEYECQAYLDERSVNPELLSLFYSFYFLSHLILHQISEARMLTKRMPHHLLDHSPPLQNCLTLLRAVWQRKHDMVYKILRELPWPDRLKPLIERYDRHFQEKTLVEVSRAYEAIRPATAAAYLGLDSASEQGSLAAIQKLTSTEWAWNEQEKLLRPKPTATGPDQNADISSKMNEIVALVGHPGR